MGRRLLSRCAARDARAIGPGWLFLTGDAADITLVQKKLGLLGDESRGLNEHSLSFIIGNQSTGVWKKASPFENPHVLAGQLGGWLHNWKRAGARAGTTMRTRPDCAPSPVGKTCFRTRCSACHTIGATDRSLASPNRVARDLTGVTRARDRTWLTR
jgi:protein SCO1